LSGAAKARDEDCAEQLLGFTEPPLRGTAISVRKPENVCFKKTLTWSNSAVIALSFEVPPLLIDSNNPAITTLLLEFGFESCCFFAVESFPGLSNSTIFRLSRFAWLGQDATGPRELVLPPFRPETLPSQQPVLNNTKSISMSRPDPVFAPGLYKLDILHLQGFQTSEGWLLEMCGLPSAINSPQVAIPIRAIAALTGANRSFRGLSQMDRCDINP